MVIAKIKELFIDQSVRIPPAQQYNGSYAYIPYAKEIGYDGLINNHLWGLYTLQSTSNENNSKWFIIDIDSGIPDSVDHCLSVIRSWLPGEYIHISDSGGKGYHIELFFGAPIDRTTLDLHANWVFNQCRPFRIECFPFEGRKNLKMPLGYNHETGNYCGYVDHNLTPFFDSKDYFLKIVPIPASLIEKIPTDEIRQTHYKGQKLDSVFSESPEELLKFGLKRTGTRHDATLRICLNLRSKGFSEDDAYDILYKWSINQRTAGMIKSSIPEIISDIKGIIDYIYNLKFHLPRKTTITEEDNQFLRSVKSNSKNAKRVLLALLLTAKRLANQDGVFSISYHQIQEVTQLKRATVMRALIKLKEQGKIQVIKRGYGGNGFKETANTYKLTVPISSGAGFQFDSKKPVSLEEIEEFFGLTKKVSSKKYSAG